MEDEDTQTESTESRVNNAVSYLHPKTVDEIVSEANATPAYVRRFLATADVDERDGFFRYSCGNDWPGATQQ